MKKKIKSKGDRLKWMNIKDVMPIQITSEMTTGKIVEIKNNENNNLIIK